MNFIKKKLKSHKKDDEEEEYEKAVYEQSLHPQNSDQKKNTEEWQFFQQLSMKVQDTVQKTQTTLSKLKDTRPDGEEDIYDLDSDVPEIPPYEMTKIPRAPPRPPPPSGEKSGPGDVDFGSEFSAPRGPPRPPPPTSEVSFGVDSSALHGTSNRSFNSPARPPPPNAPKSGHSNILDAFSTENKVTSSNPVGKNTTSFSLLDEFGFNGEPTTTSNVNMQDLLFLDDKEDVDPFDTSFVDVSNVASFTEISNSKDNIKTTENAFNPFCRPSTDDWMNNSVNDDKSKKSITNPFFTSTSSTCEETSQFSSSHNPFNFTEVKPVTSNQDDLFGLSIEPVINQDILSDDLFQSNVESPKSSVEFGYNQEFVNPAFDINEPDKDHNNAENELILNDNNSVNNIHRQSISSDVWESGKMMENSIFKEDVTTSEISAISGAADEPSLLWSSETMNQDVLVPEKSSFIEHVENQSDYQIEGENIFGTNTEVHERSGSISKDFLSESQKVSTDKMLESRKMSTDSASESRKMSTDSARESRKMSTDSTRDSRKMSTDYQIESRKMSTDYQMESRKMSTDYQIESRKMSTDFQIESRKMSSDSTRDTRKMSTDSAVECRKMSTDSTRESHKIFDTTNIDLKANDIVPETTSNNISSNYSYSQKVMCSDISSKTLDSDTFTTLSDKGFSPVSEAYNKDILECERVDTDFKDESNKGFTENFSEPFEENKQNAFVFKVKQNDFKTDLDFDAFAAKFESAKDSQSSDAFDPFMSKKAPMLKKIKDDHKGFDSMDEFDPFRISHKVADPPPAMMKKESSRDSFEDYDTEVDFSVVIKPKVKDAVDVKLPLMEPPKLLPPPKTPTKAFETPASRFNPFDKDFLDGSEISKAVGKVYESVEVEDEPVPALGEAGVRKADSVETPLSPLFDEDTSQPLEIFPKPFGKEGWEMVLRQPNKKKLTGNRFWKKIFVKLSENSVLQLFNKLDDKLPFQELPLQACYSMSEVGAQQYDQYGKIFTVKLQYKFYRERVGVRPGQISKVTQGQVQSMGDVAKLGLPLQHSAQTSQLLKLGTQSYADINYFMQEVEDAIFRMSVHRDRVLTYKTEEVQVIAQDEFYVEQSKTGHIDKQLARVRIFFLAFITGMPSVEVGLNDIIRQGKEVVGRYDIIPVVTEEWIRLEDCEFHSCVIQDEFHKSRVIKFHPPDACLFELLRFRIRPPKNRELPLQVRVFMTVSNTRVEIRSDILVPGYSSRKQGQVPCENIQIRFPVPECWIYLFRTEKHFRYGSKKSTARRPGKIKGLERIIGAAQNLDPSLIEVSAGQAKYEHVFHAVVWRIPRLPKEGQGAYTQQLFLLRTELTSFDQIPESFEQYVDVEFTMPATYVSHTTVRSVSVTNPIPPEKYVKYISKHEYKVEIDFKNSTDEIDGLIASPNVSVPTSTTPAVQESTEDDDKEEDSD